MRSRSFLELLQQIAPVELAESWDNVGVLVDRGVRPEVSRVLLTIDLTWAVLQEALTARVDAIIAYHPPIFSGLKRVVSTEPKGRLVGELLAHGLLVYSPHTALDSVPGGVNDWLADAFDTAARAPISPYVGRLAETRTLPSLPGQGRLATLRTPITLETAVERLKRHLGLAQVRLSPGLAEARAHQGVRTIAVCAGAGGALLARVNADLVITGEMRHHDVLELQQLGTSVILTDHTNCERGYLPVLRAQLSNGAPDLEVIVSTSDREPLTIT